MNKLYTALFSLLLLSFIHAAAQIVSPSPTPLQEDSKDVVLTYNASSPLGNNGQIGRAHV